MTGPSDKAIEAAYLKMGGGQLNDEIAARLTQAVDAAYPIIRADVIAEVVAALHRAQITPEAGMDETASWDLAADFVKREFRIKE